MKLTREELRDYFLNVIRENKSFEEASVWASEIMEKDELGELELNPNEDIAKVFSSLTYLAGLSTKISPKVYLYSVDDVKNEFNELFNEKI